MSKYACMPLVSSPRPLLSALLPLLALLPLAGCTALKSHPYELDDSQIGAPGVERVVLLPLNVLVGLPSELDDATGRMARLIREHLDACGVEVQEVSLADARSLWNEVAGAEPDAEAGDALVQAYIRRLRESHAADAVIQPNLLYREGRIRSVTRNVDWDGVQRTLEVKGHANLDGSAYVMVDVAGKMPAVSLHLAVYRPDGARVFDSFAGLDLVHEAELGTVYVQRLNDRFPETTVDFRLKRKRLRDEALLREGIALAFTPWLDPAVSPPTDAASR